MNVVSYFDGMRCGHVALDRADVKVDNHYAYEIDEPAIKVANKNYPNCHNMGSVVGADLSVLPNVDLLIGGSPCQTVSLANGGGGNIEDGKSALFFEFVRAFNELKPKYFLLENVPMSKANKDVISKLLGVDPIEINSNKFSIQNRKRLYWTNIPVDENIADRQLFLRDLHCQEYDDSLVLSGKGLNKLNRPRNRAIDIKSDKCPTIMKYQEKKPTDSIVFKHGDIYRYPTRRECELMQNLPIGFTDCVGYRDATGMIGNGWTVDAIAHIFKGLKQ